VEFRAFYDKKNKKLSIKPGITINNDSLLLNGALYNYFQLMKEYKFANDSRSDDEIFLRLLMLKGFDALKLMNADYSIAYRKGDKLFLLRDLAGSCPIFYSNNNDFFSFSDEKMEEGKELSTGALLEFDLKNNNLVLHDKSSIPKKEFFKSYEEMIEVFAKELFRSISIRVYNLGSFGIMNKGNTETKIIIKLCTDLKTSFVLLNPSYSKESAPEALKKVKELTGSNNFDLVQFYFACMKANEEGLKVIICDLGASLLLHDAVNPVHYYYIAKHFNINLRYPFLDIKLAEAMLRTDAKYKKNLLAVILEHLK